MIREDPDLCECGHHRNVHTSEGCRPWGREPDDHGCTCPKFNHTTAAQPGVDNRPQVAA